MGKKASDQSGRARQAAAGMMQEQRRAARRRTLLWQLGVGLVAVVLVLGIAVVVLRDRQQSEEAAAGGGPTPSQVDASGAFVVGDPEAPVAIEVVEDFQCPVCQQFEALSGGLLAEYVDSGRASVAYRGVAFLDRASSTEYSSRALNASACVMGEGEEVWRTFHGQMFLAQPPEGGGGLTDEQLVDLAAGAGAGEDVAPCIEDRAYDGWVQRTTTAVTDDGITGTPTVIVDGEQLSSFDPESIRNAVEDAAG